MKRGDWPWGRAIIKARRIFIKEQTVIVMMKRWITLTCGPLMALCFSWPGLADFNDNPVYEEEAFTSGYMEEFYHYKKQVDREFTLYKRIFTEEYDSYRKEILQYWVDGETSGKKRWLEYSPDYKTRKIVDFEKGEISIQMVCPKNDSIPEKEMTGLLLRDCSVALNHKRMIDKFYTIKA